VAGTIIADVIQSDQSYPSSINIASPMVVANTITFQNPVTVSNTFAIPAGTVSAPAFFPTGDTNTGIFFPAADQVAIATNGVERVNLGNSATVFNDGGNDVDFRVEGDTETNMLFVDAGNDRVGVGTGVPDARIHIDGAGKVVRGRQNYYQLQDNKVIAAGVAQNTVVDFLEIDLLANTIGSLIINFVNVVQAPGTDSYRRAEELFVAKTLGTTTITSKNATGSAAINTIALSASGNKIIFSYTKRALTAQAQQNFSYIEVMGVIMEGPGGGNGIERTFVVTYL